MLAKRFPQRLGSHGEAGLLERPARPERLDPRQPRQLERPGGLQTLLVVEPEVHPMLQVFGGPVFALGRQPGDIHIDLVGGKQRRPPATAETDQHPGLGQFPHRCLGDGSAGAQQQRGGIGDRDIPVERLAPLVGDILDATAIDQHPAVLQVIEIGPLRVEYRFQIGGG